MSPNENAVINKPLALDLAALRTAAELYTLADPNAIVQIAVPEVVALLDKLDAAEARVARTRALAERFEKAFGHSGLAELVRRALDGA